MRTALEKAVLNQHPLTPPAHPEASPTLQQKTRLPVFKDTYFHGTTEDPGPTISHDLATGLLRMTLSSGLLYYSFQTGAIIYSHH